MRSGTCFVLGTLLLSGCAHFWGGTNDGEVPLSTFMTSLGPDMPIQLLIDAAGEPRQRYPLDEENEVYLFHLVENSAWDGLPGPSAEAGVALLVERTTGKIRDAKITFEQAHDYPGWRAFAAGMANGRYRSRRVTCSGTASTVHSTTRSKITCNEW